MYRTPTAVTDSAMDGRPGPGPGPGQESSAHVPYQDSARPVGRRNRGGIGFPSSGLHVHLSCSEILIYYVVG